MRGLRALRRKCGWRWEDGEPTHTRGRVATQTTFEHVLVKPLRDRQIIANPLFGEEQQGSVSLPHIEGAHYAGHVWNGRMHA